MVPAALYNVLGAHSIVKCPRHSIHNIISYYSQFMCSYRGITDRRRTYGIKFSTIAVTVENIKSFSTWRLRFACWIDDYNDISSHVNPKFSVQRLLIFVFITPIVYYVFNILSSVMINVCCFFLLFILDDILLLINT